MRNQAVVTLIKSGNFIMPRLMRRRPVQMPHTAGKPENLASPPRASFPLRIGQALLRAPRHLSVFVWRLLVGSFFALAVLFLLVRYALVPQVAAHRVEIEQALSQAIGLQVNIARLDASWNGLRPELALHDLQFIDRAGRTALELPEIHLSVAWSSLWHFGLRLHRLEILRPDLDIRREADGRIFVAGLPIDSGGSGSGFQDFVLEQDQIVIRDGRLVWTDLQRSAPPLVLDKVALRLDNFLRSHRFALRASPPAAFSSSVDLRGDLRGDSFSNLDAWRGKVYLALDDADLAVWQKWTDYPLKLPRGRGGLRAWLDFDGRDVTGLTADVALADVSVRLGEKVQPLDLASLQGRVKLSLKKGMVDASAERLILAAQDGIHIGPTRLRLRYEPGDSTQAARGEFSTQQQDVQVLARLAGFLPLPDESRQRLVSADPSGQVEEISFRWEASAPGVLPARPITHFSVSARASKLVLHPVGAAPGFTGLDVQVSGTERAGTFRAGISDGGFFLPAEMHEPWLPLSHAKLAGSWSYEKPAGSKTEMLTVKLDQSEVANEHLSATVSATWQAREKGAGYLDVRARAAQAPLAQVWRYIPHAAPLDVVTWLRRSLQGGRAENLRFQLTGDLQQFPFNKSPGVFKLEARLRDAAISEFSPGWPGMDALQGTLVLDRQRLTIRADTGRYGAATAHAVKVEIADLMDDGKQVLTVDGKASGPNPDFLRYVNASHLNEMAGSFTRDIRAQGNGELTLRLDIPLHDSNHTKVSGSYAFQAPTLRLTPVLPEFSAARATLGFTEHGLSLPSASAQFLGRKVTATGLTEPDGTLRFDAQGNITVAGLRQLVDMPGWDYLSGESPVSVVVKTHEGVLDVIVDSTLSGIVSHLPAPYAKSATERWPLRFSLRDDRREAATKQVWRVALPSRLDVAWAENCVQSDCRISAGAVGVGEVAVLPAQGWQVSGTLAELDADVWSPVLEKLRIQGEGAPERGSVDLTGTVKLGRLLAGGYVFRDLSARLSKRGDDWSAILGGPDLAGELMWRDQGKGLLRARMKQLVLISAGGETEPPPLDVATIKKLPSLDVESEAFEMRGLKLGHLTLRARNEGGLWKLDTIGLKSTDLELSGTGEWQAAGLRAGTRLDFKLQSDDAGSMLGRLGYPDALRRGKVDFSGSVSWQGMPTNLHFPSLAGRVKLGASDGQFREMEPGAGRLLGILSLQSLPRRITLDFNDVFSAGFAFDRISGDMDIVGGVLHTNDLEVRGPAARVFIVGSTDLGRETHDLHIKIQPTLSESVAIGVIVGQAAVGVLNPAVGAATYLAQKLLRDPVEKIFSYEYAMRGSWSDPKVEKVGGLLVVPHAEASPAVSQPAKENAGIAPAVENSQPVESP
jgi:uncharacterized protein (TIGR02099 family)